MKVFVTGGNGFIGSVVVKTLLAEGHQVRCLLRKTSNVDRIAGLGYDRVEGDVRDAASVAAGMEGCEAAIHLASLSNWNDIDSPLMGEVVEGGTRNVLDAAKPRNTRVVFVSSVLAVNGSDGEPRTFDEQAEWTLDERKLVYSKSKRTAEKMCLDSGVPVIIVNPGEVYGPHDTALITAGNLIDFAKSKPVLVCNGGTSVVYVDDVALAIVRAMEKGRPGERYILGGENLTVRQLAELCVELLGQKKKVVQVPNGLLKGITAVARTLHIPLPYNPHVIPYATKFWFMDSSKATRELGIQFRPARETLQPTLDWLRESGEDPRVTENHTFLDVLEKLAGAREDRGFTFVTGDGVETFMSFPTLWAELSKRGRQLLSCGVAQGDRVALVIPEPDQFILTFLGAVAVGLVPVPLYPPLALAKIDSYLDGTARILGAAAADLLVTTTQVEKVLWAVMPRVPTLKGLITVEKLVKTAETPAPRPQLLPSDPVFLQFTSGSTAAPKGVIVTHKSLVANTTAIVTEGLQVSGENDDVAVSWLPLYHDMGLIGFVLAPLVTLVSVVYIPTLAFVRRPRMWFDLIHKHRGTCAFAPNFAYARLTKRATEADLARWDLSSVRVLGCGAEPIHPVTMRDFVAKFAASKLEPKTLLPCYGMAEATLAISFIGVEEQFKTDRHDGLELVCCGKPFSGHELGIFSDEDGRRLPEGEVGEIRLRGPSVAGGYFRNPEATKATFLADGWLRTGDLGYQRDGELYISGRAKDLIIIHGRNYHPQAIEWQVEEVAGVRKGNVVAFSVPGADTEELVIVAEISGTDAEQRAQLMGKVKAHVSSTLSLAAADVVLLRPGELPKTTSGKVQRRKTREQYLARTLAKDGVRTFGLTADRLALARHYMVGLASRMTHGARSLWRAMRRK